jgi:hypothetical protein
MMHRMAEVSNFGVTVAIIMVNTKMDRKMVKEYITGRMARDTLVIGNLMRCMESESLYGQMVESIRAPLSWV